MALRKRGKNGYWHAYFRAVLSNPDGTLRYALRTVNLGTTDLVTARAMEAELMAKNKAARLHQRAEAHLIRLDIEAGLRPASDGVPKPERRPRLKRLKLADALEAAAKYKAIGETTAKLWRAFVKATEAKGIRYMDEVSGEMAFAYLSERSPEPSQSKTFNNNKSALNTIFKLTMMDSGISDSPFAKIPNRILNSEHQRPFTEEEFVRIYQAATEPWKTASLIAWFTGLRQKDVFLLRWDQIDGDVITTTPGKTARFGRAVQIPIHPQLMEALTQLPRSGERVLGNWEYAPQSIAFRRAFGDILDRLGIRDDIHGIVNFNSFRDSFVTRCDAAGLPRHAIRGIVGHTDDDMTDLYSHDLTSARLVQGLPRVKLDRLSGSGET